MTKYIGRRLKLGIAKEGTRGAGATPTYLVPHLSFSIDDKATIARESAGIGVIADSDDTFITTRWAGGDLESEVRDSSFGLFLYNLLGTCSTAGPADEAYTHSFSVSETNQHQSLALLVEEPNTTEMYSLTMIESMEILVELDEIVRFTASFLALPAVGSDDTVPAITAENKFTKKHLALKVASALGGLGAATATSVKRLRLSVSKNLMLDDVLGTASPEDILNRQLTVEGEIELNYEDETWKTYFTAGTKRAMEIKLTNTDATIGAGATNPSLTIRMPRVDFFEWEPDYALDEIVSQTLSFRANYDISGGNNVISTCDLVNEVVSY